MSRRADAPSLFDSDPGAEAAADPDADRERTWGVGELHDAINATFVESFGTRTWVTGELRSLNRSAKGHTYFELVDPDPPDHSGGYNAPRLNVTLFAGRRKRVNSRITASGSKVGFEDGTILRIEGELRTYGARSTVQLLMTDIDPAFTLGVVAQQREVVLARLAAEGLVGLNAAATLPYPPMELAVVTSSGSAAHADVLNELDRSGIGFRVLSIDSRTQGAEAESNVVAALRTAESLGVEVVLLARGGGSATDLAVFDSERIGRCIAGLSVPVFTGIGHETDHCVADEVAHSSFKTPTAAAAAVVAIAGDARRRLEHSCAALGTAAPGALNRAQRDLEAAGRGAAVACRSHLDREERLLSVSVERIGSTAPRALRLAAGRIDDLGSRLVPAGNGALERNSTRLATLAALVEAHDPRRMMERGWSLTRDASGRVIRSPARLSPGEEITTLLRHGCVRSTVTERSDQSDPAPPGTPAGAGPPPEEEPRP